jgi:hypothetical protein
MPRIKKVEVVCVVGACKILATVQKIASLFLSGGGGEEKRNLPCAYIPIHYITTYKNRRLKISTT